VSEGGRRKWEFGNLPGGTIVKTGRRAAMLRRNLPLRRNLVKAEIGNRPVVALSLTAVAFCESGDAMADKKAGSSDVAAEFIRCINLPSLA